MQDATLPMSPSCIVQLTLWQARNYSYFENIFKKFKSMKNNFICSSRKYACRHWPQRRAVKLHDLRNDVVKTDSTVCMTSVCAIREQAAWSSVLHMSPPPLSLDFLHSEDHVFKEQLHTCCHLYLLLTLLPQPQMPFPPAQWLWLIMLVAINNFTGFTLSTGKGPSLHASCSYLHTHLLWLWWQSWRAAQIFPT